MVFVNKLAGDGSNTVTCLRYTGDTMLYTRMLKGHGVAVCFIDDGIMTFDSDGGLLFTIMATLAWDESRKISIRVKSG